MPFFGQTGRAYETIPDWLLGNRKWRLLAELAEADGARSVQTLAELARCSEPTAYEFVRALRPTQAVDKSSDGYVLNAENELATALLGLVRALQPYASEGVSRPPRPRA
jgi:hypothetical protein